jgi:GT2 family glycosyltransferase
VIAHDQGPALRRCLEALERTTERTRLEILVVDNGSTDDTRDITSAFAGINTLRLPKNFGETKALNIGVRTAKGDAVFILSPSVEVAPDTVMRLAENLEADTETGAVCPYVPQAYALPSADDLRTAWQTGILPGRKPLSSETGAVAVDYPLGAPIMVHRRFLAGMRYLDERYGQYWWDLELCRQLRSAGKKILVLTDVPVSYAEAPAAEEAAIDSADRALGAATYLRKHSGLMAGIRFRMGTALYSLGQALSFRDPGFNFRRFTAILSGQKIDGTHM